MAGRREVITHDRKRSSTARKRTQRELQVRQQQQAKVFRGLWKQAMVEHRAAAA